MSNHKIKCYILEILDKTILFFIYAIFFDISRYTLKTFIIQYYNFGTHLCDTSCKLRPHNKQKKCTQDIRFTFYNNFSRMPLYIFHIRFSEAAMKMSYNGAANFLSRNGTHLQSTHFYVASYSNHLNAIQWHFIYEYNNKKLKPRIIHFYQFYRASCDFLKPKINYVCHSSPVF